MEQKITDQREQRLQKLFDDCQKQVLSQIIGPFGLSTAMFEDKNGGNVTTLHNFERTDDDYIATDSDRALHKQSRKEYSPKVRSEYEVDTQAKAGEAGGKTWEKRRADKISQGRDEYTGKSVSADGTIELSNGHIVRAELDHVVSVHEIHTNPKVHLALGKVRKNAETGELNVDVSRIRDLANHDENLALTNQPLNGSKSDQDLKEWAEKKRKDGTTNKEKFDTENSLTEEKHDQAHQHIDNTVEPALLIKQTTELLQTGGKQAALMGMRQAFGLLLTELVNSLFNEFKLLIKQGIATGKTLFEEIQQRLSRAIESVIKKIPEAVGQMFQGGVSGFMSNLLTFLINNFLSTAKRFVTVIREGIIGLFRAFKMIFFPPKNMTHDQAMQEGLKILTTVVISSVGILLTETVSAFMATIPFLQPISGLITPVLIGIITGLASAFLAYQIDCWFDRYRHSLSEKFMDELLADARRRDEFACELVTLSESSLSNIENYANAIGTYQHIGIALGTASLAAGTTLASMESCVAKTGQQIKRSLAMIDFINESQSEIDDFLKNH
ncbi:hypothetical protein [Klebsiella pneumoniae]|uniref:hypothetical protein n=1 Tax=Klebsiella pneumoniae TaxID=573 RepID=UPI001F25505C|nr:hypothetical protein [Klebsiella pneumoniae]